MNAVIKYGRSARTFSLPDAIRWQYPSPVLENPAGDEAGILQNAVKHLSELLESVSGRSLLLVIPDHTRRCGIDRILLRLLPSLDKWNVKILVANGSHVCRPGPAIKELVGEAVFDNYPVLQHDFRRKDELEYLGDTSYGTPVWLNRQVREADFVITIGGVLFHYFAGFGGGAKLLMPGVAGQETIRLNHRRTIDPQTGAFHPDCYESNLDTNPVFLDLVQVLNYVPNVLSFQVVTAGDGKIVQANAGPVLKTHRIMCETVKRLYRIPIARKADVVVAGAGGFPTDVNLIQTHKAIHHAFQAVKPGGTVVVAAACSEGTGSRTFLPYFKNGPAVNIGRELLRDYRINGHTALALKTKAEKAKIILVSELDADTVRETGMFPAGSPDEAWSIAKKWLSDEQDTGYVMPEAHLFVPEVCQS